jgi:hypothetical protein
MKIIYAALLLILLASCNYVTYTPRTKRNKFLERPSMLIFDRVVDFRIEQMGWPTSKSDFMSKGKKYYEVFENCPYMEVEFKIKDSDHMTMYFDNHTRDIQRQAVTKKIDLNAYRGYAKFYKENDKFIWKLKMN